MDESGKTHLSCRLRRGHSRWTVLGFLAGAVIILLLVAHQYLLPAIRASHNLDERGRKQLAAVSILVLAVVLVMLVVGLILTIRPGRFFLPRKPAPRMRTSYVDAWEESGRRMDTPPADQTDGDSDDPERDE